MRLTKTIGLCLLAVFALSASMAGSASAETLPTIYECGKAPKVNKKYTGKYTNSGCSILATTEQLEKGEVNKYEFQPWSLAAKKNIVKPFTGKETKAGATLRIQNVASIACGSSEDKGQITGTKTAGKIEVTFFGCETAGLKCNSAGAGVGTIKTNLLSAEVGYVTKVPLELGIDIKPESGGTYLAEFTCQDLNVRVKGSVIGEIVPGAKSAINKFGTSLSLAFLKGNSEDTQRIENFEGGLPDTLIEEQAKGIEPSGENPSSQEGRITNKGEKLELVA